MSSLYKKYKVFANRNFPSFFYRYSFLCPCPVYPFAYPRASCLWQGQTQFLSDSFLFLKIFIKNDFPKFSDLVEGCSMFENTNFKIYRDYSSTEAILSIFINSYIFSITKNLRL